MSFYTSYSNEGATPWSALVDVVTHPIDSARAFVGAPVALVGGLASSAGEWLTGINTPKKSDLPLQSSHQSSLQSSPIQNTDSGLPTWLKLTIGAAAVIATVLVVVRVTKNGI